MDSRDPPSAVWAPRTAFQYHAEVGGNPRHQTVTTPDAFAAMLRWLEAAPVIAYDTETSGLAWWRHARICGMSFAVRDGLAFRAWYLPFRHKTPEAQLPAELVLGPIKRVLSDPSKLIICHNIKFDDHMSRREGIELSPKRDDTMIRARLFDENTSAELKHRAVVDLGDPNAHLHEELLDREVLGLARLNGVGKQAYKDRHGYEQIPIYLCGHYACFDAEYTFRLHDRYADIPTRFPRIYATEIELTRALADLEETGVPIDVEYLSKLRAMLAVEKQRIEAAIWDAFGQNKKFALSEDEQLRAFMQRTLKLQLWKKTRGGKLSVDQEVLEFFCEDVPSLRLILDWREANKLETTYTDSILAKLDDNSILHGDFQQMGTETGRLSCRKPNLQNLPADDDVRAQRYSGKALDKGGIDPWSVRRAFANRGKGWARLYLDYSQIELRVLAFYTRDPVLVDAYLKGQDIHTRTSLEVFGTDEKAKRRQAKVINFGLSYCLSPMGFARQTRVSLTEAEEFYKRFHERYAGIPAFRQRFWDHVRRNGGSFANLFGRERRVPIINSKVPSERARGERQSIGALIQGTAAELSKEAIVRIARWLREEKLPARLCGSVHDDIHIDTEIEAFGRVAAGAKWLMEAFPEFAPIPVVADVSYSTKSWADKMPVPGLH